MAPELLNSADAAELREIAERIRDWQLAKQISDAAVVKRYTGLGSTKTYKRILEGDLKELDLEKQLTNYRTVEALIDSLGDDDGEDEALYADISPTVHLSRVALETMRERGIARFILMLGDTGTGKSSARKVILEKYGQRFLWIEATEVWNDSPNSLLGAILSALGEKQLPLIGVDRLIKVEGRLNESRIGIFIEEAHHMGVRCLNTIKTLINRTPGEFILLAKETLWAKLERAAYEEAKQLTKNRLAERIYIAGVTAADVKKILERRINWANGDMKSAVKLVTDRAPLGNLAFAREVIKRVNEMAEGEPVTIELFTTATTEEASSRVTDPKKQRGGAR
jgi:type II secretory pathway predicted ATPase ExeA